MSFQLLKDKLEAVPGLSVSERGMGKAKFLYVRSSVRCIEVSVEADGLSIEYWDEADEESDKASVNQELATSESEALSKIKGWLLREM
jgi:hypothetical protein